MVYKMINSLSIKTKIGWISAFEKKGKIYRVKFGRSKNKSVSSNLRKFKSNLNNFFFKKRKSIKSNFHIEGDLVQKKVWKELKNIPYGKTKSYGEIARKYKLSPRHVGKICGQNKILLGIPCHRVIKSNGDIGGFSSSGGISLKKKLLDFERN